MIIWNLILQSIRQNAYLCTIKKMRKMKRIISVVILLLSFVNAYPNAIKEIKVDNNITESQSQYDKLVDLAKTYFNKNAEYAFNCAYKAHGIAERNKDCQKTAECNIIMGDIFKENNTFPTAISYYEKAIDDLIKVNDHHTIYRLYIKIAKLYQNSEFNSKWSIDAMNNALKYAGIINDPVIYNEVYMAMGDLYYSQDNYDLAEKYYNEILKNGINKNTILPISIAFTNKANISIKRNKYEEAMSMADSSLYLCIRDFNDSLQAINYSRKAQIYDSLSDFESARKYYRQSATLAYEIDDFITCGKSMFSLAHLYQRHGMHENAIGVFKIICDSTFKYKQFSICYQSCYQLSRCYASLGQYEEAYDYFNIYDVTYDSAFAIKQEKKIEELRNSYLLSLNVKELKVNEIKEENLRVNENEWKIFISIIIVLTMIIITFGILYAKNRELFHTNEVTSYEQQIKIDKIESNLMEYQLKSNRELMIKMALQIKSYVDIISPIKENLKEAIDLPEEELKSKVKSIYHSIHNNKHINSNSENINKQIESIYKDFFKKLDEKYPGLTKSDKKLCTMLFINMSSKEIAVITNTTVRSVETSRYRLRRKFGLTRDEDIVSFLQKI